MVVRTNNRDNMMQDIVVNYKIDALQVVDYVGDK